MDFECTTCGMKAGQRSQIAAHVMREHLADQSVVPFVCTLCNSKTGWFMSKGTARAHRSTKHREHIKTMNTEVMFKGTKEWLDIDNKYNREVPKAPKPQSGSKRKIPEVPSTSEEEEQNPLNSLRHLSLNERLLIMTSDPVDCKADLAPQVSHTNSNCEDVVEL